MAVFLLESDGKFLLGVMEREWESHSVHQVFLVSSRLRRGKNTPPPKTTQEPSIKQGHSLLISSFIEI